MITKLISILILCRSKDEAIDNYIRAILESLRDQMPEVRTLHFCIYKKIVVLTKPFWRCCSSLLSHRDIHIHCHKNNKNLSIKTKLDMVEADATVYSMSSFLDIYSIYVQLYGRKYCFWMR